MSAQNTIDKVVSGIPLVASILVLFSGGVLGTWFLVGRKRLLFCL